MSTAILTVDGLHQYYRGSWLKRYTVFHDFSLELERGKIYALLGRNGAGKTTLLNCILGLINYGPGEIRFNGDTITPKNIHDVLDRVTSVPSPWEMFPKLNADAYLDHYRTLYSRWDGQLEERIRSMSDFDWDRPFRDLSSGQKMQVLQALALCPEPELLVLDEPLGVTDPVVRKYFYRNIIDLVASKETTVVIATHLIQEVANLFDTALFLKQGKLVLQETAEGIRQNYRRFNLEPLPDSVVAGERGRLLSDSAILSDEPAKTEEDLNKRGLAFVAAPPTIDDMFETYA